MLRSLAHLRVTARKCSNKRCYSTLLKTTLKDKPAVGAIDMVAAMKNPSDSAAKLIEDYSPFSVIQFNVMSESFLRHSGSNGSSTKATKGSSTETTAAAAIANRAAHVIEFLLSHNADVMCLQEVDTDWYQRHLLPTFQRAGYKGAFVQRGRIKDRFYTVSPGSSHDGIAIFYRTDRFIAKEFTHVELRHALFERGARRFGTSDLFANRMLARDHVLQIGWLEMIPSKEVYSSGGFLQKPKRRSLIVGNTKLVTSDSAADISLMQAFLTARSLQTFIADRFSIRDTTKSSKTKLETSSSFSELLDSIGVVLAGDFNRLPTDPVYSFLSEGKLDKNVVSNIFGKKPPSCEIEHALTGLRSAYKMALDTEPAWTTSMGCLDYIWYSTPSLMVKSVLQVPIAGPTVTTSAGTPAAAGAGLAGGASDPLRNSFRPTLANPSDHLPLKAEFAFKAVEFDRFDPAKREKPVDPIEESVRRAAAQRSPSEPQTSGNKAKSTKPSSTQRREGTPPSLPKKSR